jgi:hypothetical protein
MRATQGRGRSGAAHASCSRGGSARWSPANAGSRGFGRHRQDRGISICAKAHLDRARTEPVSLSLLVPSNTGSYPVICCERAVATSDRYGRTAFRRPGSPRPGRAPGSPSNPASLGVSRKLGYRDDGIEWHLVRGRPALTCWLRLDHANWQATRTIPVQIHGINIRSGPVRAEGRGPDCRRRGEPAISARRAAVICGRGTGYRGSAAVQTRVFC